MAAPLTARERLQRAQAGELKTDPSTAAYLKTVAKKVVEKQTEAKKDIKTATKTLTGKHGASAAQVKATKQKLADAKRALDKALLLEKKQEKALKKVEREQEREEDADIPAGWGLRSNTPPSEEEAARLAIAKRIRARTSALKELADDEAAMLAEQAAEESKRRPAETQDKVLTARERRALRNSAPKVQRPRRIIDVVDEPEIEAAEEEEEEEEEEAAEKKEANDEDDAETESDEDDIPLNVARRRKNKASEDVVPLKVLYRKLFDEHRSKKAAAAKDKKKKKPVKKTSKSSSAKVKFKDIVEDGEVLIPPRRVKRLVQIATRAKDVKVGKGFAAQLNDRANEFAQMVAKNLLFLSADCEAKTISEPMLKKALQLTASAKVATNLETYKKRYLKGVSQKELNSLMPFAARLRKIVMHASAKGGHGFTRIAKSAVAMLQEQLFVRIIQTILKISHYLKDKGRSGKIFTACPPLVMHGEMGDMQAETDLLLGDTGTMSGEDESEDEEETALFADCPDMASDEEEEDDEEEVADILEGDSPSMEEQNEAYTNDSDEEWLVEPEFHEFMSNNEDMSGVRDKDYIDSESDAEDGFEGTCPDMKNELLPPVSSSSDDDSSSEEDNSEAEI